MADFPPDEEKIDRLRRAMYSRSLSERLHEHARRDLDEEKTDVKEDWQKTEESEKLPKTMIAPIALRSAHTLLRGLFIAGLVFFIGALGFFAYFFTFGKGASPTPPSIVISGPPAVAGGEMTELQVLVTNRNRATLELADLIVLFPEGTRSSQTLSSDITNRRVSLGTIRSGEMRRVPIRAVFIGAEGEKKTLKVELEYRLEGSNSIFVASSEYDLSFSSAPLSLSIDGNTETVSGQPVALTFNVSSNAPAPTRDVLLSVNFPFGFSYSSSDPKEVKAGLWELGDLEPGKTAHVTIRGTLTGESGDERMFRTFVGTRSTPQSASIETVLAELSHRIAISQPFIGLSVDVNKESAKTVTVVPGETVNVSITWQNNLATAVTDAVIVARLSGIEIDGSTVQTTDGFYRSSDNVILWDRTTTGGDLANLASGASGTVSFSFTMPATGELQGLRDPRLTLTVNAAGKRLSETGVPTNLQATVVRTLRLASELEIFAQGLYHDNPFGSTGPLPPKAGEETSYAILFTITNTTGKVKGAKLAAQLPPYVRTLGMHLPAGEKLSYNNIDGTIMWTIGDIESGTGIAGSPGRQVVFGIGFTPSTSQIGEAPVLLQDIKFTGTDGSTGAAISKTVKNITTNIMGDSGFVPTEATVVR